ncbi:MAG: hypothetical protein ACRDWY_11935 [Actinomycetes bacterium]
MTDSPYVLVSMSVEHPEPYRATERLRRTFPASDPPDGWLWCYLRPERRDRFQVAVLMERRPAGCDALLDALAALDCGDATGQEVDLYETVLPPRTPLTLRLRLLARRMARGAGT